MVIRKWDSSEARAITKALDLKPDLPLYELTSGSRISQEEGGHNTAALSTRSLMNMITFMSLEVEVPELHLDKGLTSRAWPPGSEGNQIADLVRIRSSSSRPGATFSTKYRGRWFYIAEDDLVSKFTFLHMAEIFRFELKETEEDQSPVLTLNVGQ